MGSALVAERIAAEYRKKRKIPVIGITGSVGKTTLKEMTAQILSQKYFVHKNEGSYNGNESAVRNVLSIKAHHQVCVFELGIDDAGQMERMVDCCRPTIPVFTGICDTHLEKLGSQKKIYEEKSHIFDTLPVNGKVIANGDDKVLMRYLHEDDRIADENIFTYGLEKSCMFHAEKITSHGLNGSTFMVYGDWFLTEPLEVTMKIPGEHMVQNATGAILLGILFDVPTDQITHALETMNPVKERCQILQGSNVTVIDDAYNASVASAKAALSLLKQVDGRKVSVLGDMNELGATEKKAHEEIGRYADLVADESIFVGSLAKYMYDAARKQGRCGKVFWYEDKASFLKERKMHILPNDTILIKASHKQGFSELVQQIMSG